MLNLLFLKIRRFNINYVVFSLSLLHAFFTGGSYCLPLFFFRGLAFTCKALQNMQSDTTSELHICFKRAYDEVLGRHHSFVIRSVVSVSLLFSCSITLANLLYFILLCHHFFLGPGPLPVFFPGPWTINCGPITHLTLHGYDPDLDQ